MTRTQLDVAVDVDAQFRTFDVDAEFGSVDAGIDCGPDFVETFDKGRRRRGEVGVSSLKLPLPLSLQIVFVLVPLGHFRSFVA